MQRGFQGLALGARRAPGAAGLVLSVLHGACLSTHRQSSVGRTDHLFTAALNPTSPPAPVQLFDALWSTGLYERLEFVVRLRDADVVLHRYGSTSAHAAHTQHATPRGPPAPRPEPL
jgi:hypothetical protein